MKLADRIAQFRNKLEGIEPLRRQTGGFSKEIRWEQTVMELLDLKLSEIYKQLQHELSPEQEQAFELAEWSLRLGIPLSRVFGRRFFYNATFVISPFVLDPRPETEALVEYVVGLKPASVLDLGTGSGCILISILAETEARGVGVDISARAIQNATENAIRLGLLPETEATTRDKKPRVEFILGDFAETYGKFEVVVSNPPYIPNSPINPPRIPNSQYISNSPHALQSSISYTQTLVNKSALTDPPVALFDANSTSDDSRMTSDLSCYKKIIMSDNLMPGGRLVFEIPEPALAKTIDFAAKHGMLHEFSKEIGNELHMCVLNKFLKRA